MKRIGFITSGPDKLPYFFPTAAEPHLVPTEPPFTPDDKIAVDRLRCHYDMTVDPVIWGTPVTELAGYDLMVIRSPWDYAESAGTRRRFIEWIDTLDNAGLRVLNTGRFIRWMLDKHYLQDFEEAGVSIVPTRFTSLHEPFDLGRILKEKGPFVIKPCVSAWGAGLRFIRQEQDLEAHAADIYQEAEHGDFMIQDYMEDICTNGEWSLIYFGSEFSHAVHKIPAPGSILVHAERGGSLTFDLPGKKVLDFGARVIESLAQAFQRGAGCLYNRDALYIRVDIIEGPSGCSLTECEGVEPELFFRARKGSEDAFARHLCRYLP